MRARNRKEREEKVMAELRSMQSAEGSGAYLGPEAIPQKDEEDTEYLADDSEVESR